MATNILEARTFRFDTDDSDHNAAESYRPIQDVDDDTGVLAELTQVADAISRDLDGDGVLVMWVPADGHAKLLYHGGAPGVVTDAQVAAAQAIARQNATNARTYWRSFEGSAAAGMLAVAFAVEGGTIIVAVLFARIERTTKTCAVEGIARILPLVQPFVAGWAARIATETMVQGMTAALDGIGIGILLVDREGHVMVANSAADRLIQAGDGLRRRGRMLLGAKLVDTAKLHAAIDQAVAPCNRPTATDHQVLPLARTSGSPLIAAVLPTRQTALLGSAAAAIVCVVDPDLDVRSLVGRISEIYGMSRVETRLAGELAMGRSLIEAASSLRIREATARSYLKQLFLKTGTHRQVELVRLLIAGTAAMPAGLQPIAK